MNNQTFLSGVEKMQEGWARVRSEERKDIFEKISKVAGGKKILCRAFGERNVKKILAPL